MEPNRRRPEGTFTSDGTEVCNADFPDIDVWPRCWRSIRLQLRRNTFGGAADFTKPAVPSVAIRQFQTTLSLYTGPTIGSRDQADNGGNSIKDRFGARDTS